MKINNRIVYVFDNGGETLDRYTIIFHSNGEVLGASENPFRGFGQHCGNLVDNIMFHQYGGNWRSRCSIRKVIRYEISKYINLARADSAWLGKEITDPNKLPINVIRFIYQSL